MGSFPKTIFKSNYVDFTNKTTVKLVYNDHPWDPNIVAVVDRWSLFSGHFTLDRWSLFNGHFTL